MAGRDLPTAWFKGEAGVSFNPNKLELHAEFYGTML